MQSTESANWLSGVFPDIGARIWVTVEGNRSNHRHRRIGSAMVCFPRRLFMKRRSCDVVRSSIVTLKISRIKSSSEQPVCLSIACLNHEYGSCSGTVSNMSATWSTMEVGNADTKQTNLNFWKLIFVMRRWHRVAETNTWCCFRWRAANETNWLILRLFRLFA